MLHNLDENFTGDTSSYLKIMADYYTTLGGMVGIEGAMKPVGIISTLSGSLSLGFSNTVFLNSGNTYVPYSSAGKKYYDNSNFMGLSLPFRYGGQFSFALSNPFSFRINLPVYSDPYFKDDFGKRSEYMDWINFLMSGATGSESTGNTVTNSAVTSLSWDMTGSYSFKIPDFLKPYISSLELSSVNSSLVFSTKTNSLTSTDNWPSYTPQRLFYYPSQVTPFKISAKISGTLVQYPKKSTASAQNKTALPFPLTPPDLIEPPEEKKDGGTPEKNGEESPGGSNEEKSDAEKSVVENQPAENKNILGAEGLPALSESPAKSITNIAGLTYNLTYSLNPQFTTQITYDAASLESPDKFDWSSIQSSYLQFKAPTVFTSTLSYGGSFLSMTNTLSLDPAVQSHPNTDGYTASSALTVKKADYTASSITITESNALSVKPFIFTDVLKDTGLTWNTSAKLLRTKFLGDAENPEWQYMGLDVTNPESLTSHSLSATLSANEGKSFSQTLTLTTTLPPQNSSYSGVLKLVFPYVSTSFQAGVKEVKNSSGTTKWTPDLFKQSASVSLFSGTKNVFSFTESFNYNWETMTADALKLTLSWRGLSFSYVMGNTYGYDFDSASGWTARSQKEFLPQTLSLSYSLSAATFKWWKNRITFTPSLSTSVVYDLLRPTNSYFTFVPSISFAINEFLSITFSSESRNSVIYRYFQGGSSISLPGETNLLVDLFNSFVFWGNGQFIDPDQTVRKSSGFKLKSMKLTITHNLCDWDFNASFSISPRLVTINNRKQYSFDPYFSFSVVWKPMGSFKANVVDKYGEWQLNP